MFMKLNNKLARDQIVEIANDWHSERKVDHLKQDRLKKRFIESVDKSEYVRELIISPMMLNVLMRCSRYEELPKYRLPLYRLCVQFMVCDWDIERLLENTANKDRLLDSEDKEEILQTVAAEMKPYTNDSGFTQQGIVEYELQSIIEYKLNRLGFCNPKKTADSMIEKLFYFQDHLLSHTGEAFYVFAHQRFFEYFYATYFVDLFKHKEEIDFEYLKKEIFGKHWCDVSWHGTLVLIVAGIHRKFALKIIEYLMAQSGESRDFVNVFLAAECFIQMQAHKFRESTTAATILCDNLKALSNPKFYPDTIWRRASLLLYELKW